MGGKGGRNDEPRPKEHGYNLRSRPVPKPRSLKIEASKGYNLVVNYNRVNKKISARGETHGGKGRVNM